MKWFTCVLACVISILAAPAAQAQAYPARPVRLVITGAPGQATDVLARLVAQKLSDRLKQQVVVDNKAGAGGNLAADAVAKAAPDGYTLLMATSATHALNAAVYPNMTFDPINDFAPVAMVGMVPLLVSLAPDVPATSMKELLALGRARPGSLNVAIPSTSARAALQLLQQNTSVEFFPITYKTSAFIDLISGRLQMTIESVSATLPQMSAGKVKVLAVLSAHRFEGAPNVPTMTEAGVPGVDLAPWNALVAPRGTPREIVTLLNAQVAAVLAEPEVRKRLIDLGFQPVEAGTPEQLGAFIRSETQKWGDLARKAKITLD